jgi:predicted nucleotidyltransferase
MDDQSPRPAEAVIATLRAHDAELRRSGIRHLAVFGSAARGEAQLASDIDLVVELDPAAQVGLFRLMGLQRRLSEILGRRVDLLPEPVENPRLQQKIDRDRRLAF